MRLALFLILMLLMLQTVEGMEYKGIINASQILTNISKGLPVEYDHVIIKGNLNLNNLKGLPIIHINRTKLEKWSLGASEDVRIIAFPIRINDSIIDGIVNFNNTLLENITDFTGSKFNSFVDLNDSIFNSSADFRYSKFNSPADFSGSIFNSYVDFDYSTFNSSADFRYSTSNSPVYFSRSKFESVAKFSGSTFNSHVDFKYSEFNSSADFRHSKFNSFAYFSSSKFNSVADFSDSRFNNSTYFEDIVFANETTFSDSKFRGDTSFRRSQFKEDALFEDTVFNDTLYLTRTKYDKLYIAWGNIHRLAYDDAAYQLLIGNFRKLGLDKDADNCYYQFRADQFQNWKNSRRFQEDQLISSVLNAQDSLAYFFDGVAWISYGYGKRPLYPALWSLFFIAVFGVFWHYVGLGIRDWPPAINPNRRNLWWHALTFSLAIFLSGTKLFINPPDIPVLKGRSEALLRRAFIFERALGAFLSLLFFLAIGATVVRQ